MFLDRRHVGAGSDEKGQEGPCSDDERHRRPDRYGLAQHRDADSVLLPLAVPMMPIGAGEGRSSLTAVASDIAVRSLEGRPASDAVNVLSIRKWCEVARCGSQLLGGAFG
jgi:hypothetical protein